MSAVPGGGWAVKYIESDKLRRDDPKLCQPRYGRLHTGVIDSQIKAVEAVGRVRGQGDRRGDQKAAAVLLTDGPWQRGKDGGRKGGPMTAHTTSLVPLLLVDETSERKLADKGAL